MLLQSVLSIHALCPIAMNKSIHDFISDKWSKKIDLAKKSSVSLNVFKTDHDHYKHIRFSSKLSNLT